jgi:hypothetical protein
MGTRGTLFLLAACCLAAPAVAQTEQTLLPSRPIAAAAAMVSGEPPARQLAELARWTREYQQWEAWFLRWRSRPEPGVWSTRPRRQPPVPPAWLPEACTATAEEASPLADACRAWREWSSGDEGAGVVQQQVAQARSAHEAPRNTAWWEHVHVDGLWPMTQTGSNAIGVAGMHTTASLTKRLEVFLAPGAILMRVPSVTGGMAWSAATDWGFSYRLVNFRMPAMSRSSTLHFNMVRVWMLGRNALQTPGEMYLAGFSVTFTRR